MNVLLRLITNPKKFMNITMKNYKTNKIYNKLVIVSLDLVFYRYKESTYSLFKMYVILNVMLSYKCNAI